jgi:hypothetical protein
MGFESSRRVRINYGLFDCFPSPFNHSIGDVTKVVTALYRVEHLRRRLDMKFFELRYQIFVRPVDTPEMVISLTRFVAVEQFIETSNFRLFRNRGTERRAELLLDV